MLHTPTRTDRVAATPVRVPRQRQSYDETTAPSGRSPSRMGRVARLAVLLPVLLCGIAALAGAATLGAVAVGSAEHTSHAMRLPARAGDLQLTPLAGTQLAARADSAADGFRDRFGSRLRSVKSGVYTRSTESVGAPVGAVVFVGAAIDTSGDPGDFVGAFEKAARDSGYDVERVPAGRGAHGVCMARDSEAATCAWSTGDSIGEVIPAVTGWDVDRLAQAMRDLRAGSEYERS